MRNKIKKIIYLLLLIFLTSFFNFGISHAQYNYTPLERIPGFESGQYDFPNFILNLYKFGIWTVAIAALLMVTIGGFMYLTSAGNMAKNDNAKGVIRDALIGLILAMVAYLILYVINPDLVRINISLQQVNLAGTGGNGGGGGGNGGGGGTGGSGTGACQPITTGPCSVSNLSGTCFGSNAERASAICNAESGGNAGSASGVDRCRDGQSFSYGLFQINLTCQCKEAFSPYVARGCANSRCTVTNQSAYNACVARYTNPADNIAKACEIYGSQGWNGWGVNSRCGF